MSEPAAKQVVDAPYVFQEDFLSRQELDYWRLRIKRDLARESFKGEITVDDKQVSRPDIRVQEVNFLEVWDPHQTRHDATMALRLLYQLSGFGAVASTCPPFGNLGMETEYDSEHTLIQFGRYRPGGHYAAHVDGDKHEYGGRKRVMSLGITVSAANLGGRFFFRDMSIPMGVKAAINRPGTLVAFPSETWHGVTPVIAGERLSIVSWLLGRDVVK